MKRLVACALLLSSGALAQAPEQKRVRFSWQRGPGAQSCPGEAELGRRIAARIGRDPFSDDADRSIDARVARLGDRWRAEVRVLDQDGRPLATREPLESTAADCAALADAVVLAVALTIDPDAAFGASPTSTTPPPELPALPAPRAQASCPVATCPHPQCPPCPAPEAKRSGARARASLRALGALGVLPAPAFGVSLAAELMPSKLISLGLAIHYLPEVESDDGDLAFGFTAVELFGCPDLIGTNSAALSMCFGFQVGSLHALSRALRPVEPGDYAWIAPTLGPRARIELGPVAYLDLGAAAAVPLIEHDFTIVGRGGSGYEPATMGVFGWIGVGWTSL